MEESYRYRFDGNSSGFAHCFRSPGGSFVVLVCPPGGADVGVTSGGAWILSGVGVARWGLDIKCVARWGLDMWKCRPVGLG